MVMIVARVACFAVGSICPMALPRRVYSAATQESLAGMVAFTVRCHGLPAQFGADQCAADSGQISASPIPELPAHKSADHGAREHTAQFRVMMMGAFYRNLPAMLPSDRCPNATLVIVIVQGWVRQFICPVTRAVMAAVGSGRRAADRAHGEQDHDADA